jgi:hypothetical protein
MMSEQEKRIRQIVKSAQDQDEYTIFETWHAYLEKHLKVPFSAVVAEYQSGPIRAGDQVSVMGISEPDDHYGTLVHAKHKREFYEFPLCDLKAPNTDTQTEQLVDDYAVWFANR